MSIHRFLFNQFLSEEDFKQICALFLDFANYPKEGVYINGEKVSCVFADPKGNGVVANVGSSYLYIFHYDRTKNVIASVLDLAEFNKLLDTLPDCVAKTDILCFSLENVEALDTHYAKILQDRLPMVSTKQSHQLSPLNSFQQNVSEYLIEHKGLLFYHAHVDLSSFQILADNMPLFKHQGVSVCFLELPHRHVKYLLYTFNKTGDLKLLEKHVSFLNYVAAEMRDGLILLARAAFANGIKLVPVDEEKISSANNNVEHRQDLWHTERETNGNHVMIWHIQKYLDSLEGQHKFIGLFGLAHIGISHALGLHSYGVISEQFNNNQTNRLFKIMWLDKFIACDYLDTIPNLHDQQRLATGRETPAEKLKRRAIFKSHYGDTIINIGDHDNRYHSYQRSDSLARLCQKYGRFVAVAVTVTAAGIIIGTNYMLRSSQP